jgi:uncharacterized membrane protein YkoI
MDYKPTGQADEAKKVCLAGRQGNGLRGCAAVLSVAILFGVVMHPASAQDASPQDARVVAEAKCWSDWSEAAVIVRRETLMPVERVNKLAREKHPGAEIIKVTLCEEVGKFVYRVVLRQRQGQLQSVLLDARQPEG